MLFISPTNSYLSCIGNNACAACGAWALALYHCSFLIANCSFYRAATAQHLSKRHHSEGRQDGFTVVLFSGEQVGKGLFAQERLGLSV